MLANWIGVKFQSAPRLVTAEKPLSDMAMRLGLCVFQSAPRLVTAEKSLPPRWWTPRRVSIRSAARHRGEGSRSVRSMRSRKFQSAPRLVTAEKVLLANGLWVSDSGVRFANPVAARPEPTSCLPSTSL